MRKEVYICDGDGCGKVLLKSEDGFVLTGCLATGVPYDSIIAGGQGHEEVALCRACMLQLIESTQEHKPEV